MELGFTPNELVDLYEIVTVQMLRVRDIYPCQEFAKREYDKRKELRDKIEANLTVIHKEFMKEDDQS